MFPRRLQRPRRNNFYGQWMKLLSLLAFLAASSSILQAGSPLVDRIGIGVTTTPRQFAYTNKQAGTYYGEVNDQNSGGWQGWFVNAQKILNDYSFELNGRAVDRTTASTTVLPYQLIRKYPDGAEERFTFLDSVNAIVVEYKFNGTKRLKYAIDLHVTQGFEQDESSTPAFSLWQRKSAPIEGPVPTWIGLSSKSSSSKVPVHHCCSFFRKRCSTSEPEHREKCRQTDSGTQGTHGEASPRVVYKNQ